MVLPPTRVVKVDVAVIILRVVACVYVLRRAACLARDGRLLESKDVLHPANAAGTSLCARATREEDVAGRPAPDRMEAIVLLRKPRNVSSVVCFPCRSSTRAALQSFQSCYLLVLHACFGELVPPKPLDVFIHSVSVFGRRIYPCTQAATRGYLLYLKNAC